MTNFSRVTDRRSLVDIFLVVIAVVPNDKDELIPQRIITGYRMVIDFRKLNKATKKDHYPLPFIDQMLE